MNECDVCEAPDGAPHCDCGQCDCGEVECCEHEYESACACCIGECENCEEIYEFLR